MQQRIINSRTIIGKNLKIRKYEIAMIRNINIDEFLRGVFHMTINKQIIYI